MHYATYIHYFYLCELTLDYWTVRLLTTTNHNEPQTDHSKATMDNNNGEDNVADEQTVQ